MLNSFLKGWLRAYHVQKGGVWTFFFYQPEQVNRTTEQVNRSTGMILEVQIQIFGTRAPAHARRSFHFQKIAGGQITY